LKTKLFEADLAVHRLHQPATDRQPDAAAFLLGEFDAKSIERLENSRWRSAGIPFPVSRTMKRTERRHREARSATPIRLYIVFDRIASKVQQN